MRRRFGDFTLRQLDTFVCAARSGSFALAADQLGISQPAVSDHISALERHLGHCLFERRRGTTPMLTPEGRDMLNRAEALLSTSQAMRADGNRAPADGKLRVRLSIGSGPRDTYLKPLLLRIYQEMPHVELEILPVLPAREVAAALDNGEIDLLLCAIGGRPPLDLPHIHLLGELPIRLVAAPTVARRIEEGLLPYEDLRFVLPDFGVIAEQWLEDQLGRVGIHPRGPVRHLQFADLVQALVEDGLGVSVLLDEQTAPAMAAGRLAPFGPPLDPMWRIVARSPHASRAVEDIERLLVQEIALHASPH